MPKSFLSLRQTLLFAVILAVFVFSVTAATLPEYRENIQHLKDDLDSIIAPEDDSTDAQEDREFEREVLAEFPKLLPRQEKIEWENSTFEVNNQWVYEALNRLEKEPPTSPKRQAILTEIRERLAALEEKLGELETQTAAINTKDVDKRKLAEILRRTEFQKPEEKQTSVIEKLYLRIINWLAEIFPRPNISPSSADGFQSLSFVLQMILYALILGGVGFLIYRFAPFFMNKYRYREKREKKARVILGERLAANETAQNLFDEAESLARQGNLRGAIRKGYIALLCELSDRKIIGLSQHKTNRDYLRDVRQQNDLYANMSGLTVNYERHWYGFENAEEKDWEEFRSGYQSAVGSSSRQ